MYCNLVERFIYKLYLSVSTMVFFRVKSLKSGKGKLISYLYLCENHWDKQKQSSRQKVLLYLGKVKGFEPIIVKEVFAKCGSKCVKCGRLDTLTIDHIIPSSKGGNNHIDNLQILCQKCNRKKGKDIPKELEVHNETRTIEE